MSGRFRAIALALAAVAAVAGAGAVRAGGTLTWSEAPADLAQGRADGLGLSDRGRLFLAPRIERSGRRSPAGPAHVWALVGDRDGNLYLGTGPDGQVLKIAHGGAVTELFASAAPLVSALAVMPDGRLVAAANPGGLIYRVETDGTVEPWTIVDEAYVWALAAGPDGSVYAGTGERGRVVRIDRSGNTETVFDSEESHIVSLLPLDDGGLLAGGSGRGLVYRIDDEGHALVLHDDELPEAVSLALGRDGEVYVAFQAWPEAETRQPAVRLRLPDGVEVGATDEASGMLEEGRGPTLRGTIEGLPRTEAPPAPRTRGRVVRIDADGGASELWSSTTEAPFCLELDGAGRLLFGTGEPARLYRVEADGDIARLARFDEAQLTGLLRTGRSVVLAASNPAKTYLLQAEVSEFGVYLSRPFDAGGLARWGSIRWIVDEPSGRTELYTRTGNSREPDTTWSAWSPAITDPTGGVVVNPEGRYLQWRLRQIGGRAETRLHGVTVQYEPYNRAPELRDFRKHSRGEASVEALTFVASTRDADGDTVEILLQYRPAGAQIWASAATVDVPRPVGDPADWRDAEIAWTTAAVQEGTYDVMARAGDQPSNAPGEALESATTPTLRVVVDRTPPRIEIESGLDGALLVRLDDGYSDIRRLELLERGRVRFMLRPEDGICDSGSESFRFRLPAEPGPWSLRGVDAAGNGVEQPVAAATP